MIKIETEGIERSGLFTGQVHRVSSAQAFRALSEQVQPGDQAVLNLMTLHPSGGHGSAEWFHDDEWLSFNLRQNGHVAEFSRYAHTRADYDRAPAKPMIDGEPLYEDHPLNFKASENGYSIAADVRRPLYWDLFSGACGHTDGHHSVWQFWQAGRAPVNNPLLSWRAAHAAGMPSSMRRPAARSACGWTSCPGAWCARGGSIRAPVRRRTSGNFPAPARMSLSRPTPGRRSTGSSCSTMLRKISRRRASRMRPQAEAPCPAVASGFSSG